MRTELLDSKRHVDTFKSELLRSREEIERLHQIISEKDYNRNMKIILKPIKQRYHKALFDNELPFKPKVERCKKQYSRKEKYKVDYRLQEV